MAGPHSSADHLAREGSRINSVAGGSVECWAPGGNSPLFVSATDRTAAPSLVPALLIDVSDVTFGIWDAFSYAPVPGHRHISLWYSMVGWIISIPWYGYQEILSFETVEEEAKKERKDLHFTYIQNTYVNADTYILQYNPSIKYKH